MDWGRRWLVDFNAEKAQLVLFNQSNNNSAIDMKMNEWGKIIFYNAEVDFLI